MRACLPGLGLAWLLLATPPATAIGVLSDPQIDGLGETAGGGSLARGTTSIGVDAPGIEAATRIAELTQVARDGTFAVRYACRDRCDPSPRASATFAGRPVESGELVRMAAGSGRRELRVRCEDASGNAAVRAVLPGMRARGEPPFHDRSDRRNGHSR